MRLLGAYGGGGGVGTGSGVGVGAGVAGGVVTVRRGQAVGAIGMTGRATGPHLHWSMKWHSAKLDALLFVGQM